MHGCDHAANDLRIIVFVNFLWWIFRICADHIYIVLTNCLNGLHIDLISHADGVCKAINGRVLGMIHYCPKLGYSKAKSCPAHASANPRPLYIRVWKPLGTMMKRGIVKWSWRVKVPPSLRSRTPTRPKKKLSVPVNPNWMSKPAQRTQYPCG